MNTNSYENHHIKNVVVIPTDGFANRLRSIAAGFILANEIGAKFYMNWYSDDGMKFSFNDFFENEIKSMNIDEMKDKNYFYDPSIQFSNVIDNVLDDVRYDTLLIQGAHEYKHKNINDLQYCKKKK